MSAEVTIENLEPEYFQVVGSWLSNKDNNRWLTSEWRGREVTGSTIAIALRNRRNRIYLVRLNRHPCGIVAFADLDTPDSTAMVWYVLGDPELKGKGVIPRALKLLTKIGFYELGLKSLYAWIIEDNLSSRRVLEKVGFRELGRIRQAASSGGKQVDRVYFDLTPSPA